MSKFKFTYPISIRYGDLDPSGMSTTADFWLTGNRPFAIHSQAGII